MPGPCLGCHSHASSHICGHCLQLCHLAAEENLRPQLAQEGVIGGLVSLLSCAENEVVVRALLGLGMLCGAK
jgi:hypothetical protein